METYDTWTLEFESVDGNDGFPFAPGQFNMVYGFGVGEVPISISGDPGKPEKLVHTIRSVGAVTKALCNLKRADELMIRGPYGTHWPVEEAVGHDVVIVSGGVGLAPLRPAIYHLLSNRRSTDESFSFTGQERRKTCSTQPRSNVGELDST